MDGGRRRWMDMFVCIGFYCHSRACEPHFYWFSMFCFDLAVCSWFWVVVHIFGPYLVLCRTQCRFLLAERFDLKLSEAKSSSRFWIQTKGDGCSVVEPEQWVTIDRKNGNDQFVRLFIYFWIMFVPCSLATRSTIAMFWSAFKIICNARHVVTRDECICIFNFVAHLNIVIAQSAFRLLPYDTYPHVHTFELHAEI